MEDEFLNKKIDEILGSMDGIKRADPRPFLFTRLEARMQNERNVWNKLSSFVARPVVAFACICFVLILNAMVIVLSNTSNTSGNSLAQQGSELATVDEYSQVSFHLYDFENSKP